MPVHSWPVTNFGLASFKGSLLVVGGKFTSADKPAGGGTYSNQVYTYSPRTNKIKVTLPPMRVGCASPAVVTHEGLIIVVHGEGADSGVEALDTTSPNPDWKQVEQLPYNSATPSATIAAGCLIVWIGTLYCMHLSCITSPKQASQYLPSRWFALPSPPDSISLQLANYKGRLAAFTIGRDHLAYLYVFDHALKQWIRLQDLPFGCPSSTQYERTLYIRASMTTQSVVIISHCLCQNRSGHKMMQLAVQTGRIQNEFNDDTPLCLPFN